MRNDPCINSIRHANTIRKPTQVIKAPLLAINSRDDFINPPELGMIERGSNAPRTAALLTCRLPSRQEGMARTHCRRSGRDILVLTQTERVSSKIASVAVWLQR